MPERAQALVVRRRFNGDTIYINDAEVARHFLDFTVQSEHRHHDAFTSQSVNSKEAMLAHAERAMGSSHPKRPLEVASDAAFCALSTSETKMLRPHRSKANRVRRQLKPEEHSTDLCSSTSSAPERVVPLSMARSNPDRSVRVAIPSAHQDRDDDAENAVEGSP